MDLTGQIDLFLISYQQQISQQTQAQEIESPPPADYTNPGMLF